MPRLVTLTSASGSTEPEASLTVPVIEPVSCARIRNGVQSNARSAQESSRKYLRFISRTERQPSVSITVLPPILLIEETTKRECAVNRRRHKVEPDRDERFSDTSHRLPARRVPVRTETSY